MTQPARRRTTLLISGCLAAMFTGCGGYSAPTMPSGGPQSSPAPVRTPDPSPSPSDSPTPSPAPVQTPVPTPTPSPSAVVIEIVGEAGGMSFAPASASVRVGQEVRWHNSDSIVHTATQNGGGFDTGLIGPGSTSAPVRVTIPGPLNYHCAVHPDMVGSLSVTQ